MDNTKNNAEILRDAVVASQQGLAVDDQRVLLVPEGYQLHDLDPFKPTPFRKSGTVRMDTVESFTAYLNRHKDAGAQVFAHARIEEGGRTDVGMVALLNDHQAGATGKPGWGDHRVSYAPKLSRPWVKWMLQNGKAMSQAMSQGEFAEFLEDNLPDIAEPPAAKLLEVCAGLQAKQSVSFKQGVRLQDGTVEFEYKETTETSGGGRTGKMQIPEGFTLGLAPFEGMKPYKVLARLRWRIDGESKHLRFFYLLNRPEDVLEEAFEALVEHVQKHAEKVPVFRGEPRLKP